MHSIEPDHMRGTPGTSCRHGRGDEKVGLRGRVVRCTGACRSAGRAHARDL